MDTCGCILFALIIMGFNSLNLNTRKHQALGEVTEGTTNEATTLAQNQGESELPANSNSENDFDATTIAAAEDVMKNGTKLYHLYEHVDREELMKGCTQAKECPSSELYWIVCGSDGVNYKNLGLLACAQRCQKDLKLQGFGPCQNSKPLPTPSFPTFSTSTTSKPIDSQQLKELVEGGHVDENELLAYLKKKIKSRHHHRGGSQEMVEWCRDNPDRCPYGYDPSINPDVYIIPAAPYIEEDVPPVRHFA